MKTSDWNANSSTGRVPVVVGVTGHRDLREGDVQGIREWVRGQLNRLLEDHEHTPMVVLSALAEGADTLVAEVALEVREHSAPGRVRVVGVLPMPGSAYAADFGPGHEEKLEGLLAELDGRVELRPADGVSADDLRENPELREGQYELLAAFLARHCHVLLALWNGVDSEARGGTATVVKWFKEGIPARLAPYSDPLDQPDGLYIRHRLVKRATKQEGVGKHWEEADDPNAIRVLKSIDEFNADGAEHYPRISKRLRNSREDLLPAGEQASLARNRIADTYAVADALCLGCYQPKSVQLKKLMLALALTSVALFAAFAHLCPHFVPLQVGFLAATIGALAVPRYVSRRRIEVKHLVYRALAEALRLENYWQIAGVPSHVFEQYERLHGGDVDWIRQAVRGIVIPEASPGETAPTEESGPEAVDRVREDWVRYQRGWYGRRIAEKESSSEKFSKWSKGLVAAGLVFALGLFAFSLLTLGEQSSWVKHALHGSIVFLVLLFAVAGVVHEHARHAMWKAEAKRYRAAAELYDLAEKKLADLPDAGSLDAHRRILLALGREALNEHLGWLLLHRDHPMDILPHI